MDETLDLETKKGALESRLAALEAYRDHPITRECEKDAAEQQEALINLICEIPIHSIETFFAHFEAVGHLRGLRRPKSLLDDKFAEVQQQLKALEIVEKL